MIPKFENLVHKLNDFRINGDHVELCKFTLKIKTLFLNFILYLINDFEDFYKKDIKNEPASKQASAHEVFDFKKYCKSENYKAFKERFVQSQAFIHFIEEAYHMDKGHIPKQDGICFFKK